MSPQATVISPPSWGSAVELSRGLWRKKLLPVGDVQYGDRTLHFTPSYLKTLEDAFRDRAYDAVSFQLADHANRHSNDPERHRGTITDMRVEQDGLWITVQPTERGEQILKENPYLGISARIVESYQRSDGKHYDAAVQHCLGTLDPRVPGLGQWQPLDMANSGGLVIDLSSSTWAGEPGAPLPADDQLTDQELSDLIDAMTQADAELGQGYELPPEYAGFDRQFSASYAAEAARDQARAADDEQDARRGPGRLGHESEHDRMDRLMSRISAGTYRTEQAALGFSNEDRATELTMVTGEGLCGQPDPFGRCSSRFHDLMCIHAVSTDWQASEPPRSTYTAALSNFAAGHVTGTGPAYGGDPGDPDAPAYPIPQHILELAHRAAEDLGVLGDTWSGPVYPKQARAGYPDVSELARGVGLR